MVRKKKNMLSFSKIWFRGCLLIIQRTLKYLASFVSISHNCISILVEGVSTPSETAYYPFLSTVFLRENEQACTQKTPSSAVWGNELPECR